MFIILFRKPRGPWSILRSMIARRQQLKRNAQTTAFPAQKAEKRDVTSNESNVQDQATTQEPDFHATRTTKRDIPCCSDTELIVSQLAGLAATVSRSSPKNAAHSKRSSFSSSVMRTVNMQSGGNNKEEPEEENFHYLRSLITVSCPSQHSSRPILDISNEEKESQPPSRKRASSRLSLRLGNLPRVPVVPKVSRKPCPHYTCLPPAWTPKAITVRPEVRF